MLRKKINQLFPAFYESKKKNIDKPGKMLYTFLKSGKEDGHTLTKGLND